MIISFHNTHMNYIYIYIYLGKSSRPHCDLTGMMVTIRGIIQINSKLFQGSELCELVNQFFFPEMYSHIESIDFEYDRAHPHLAEAVARANQNDFDPVRP